MLVKKLLFSPQNTYFRFDQNQSVKIRFKIDIDSYEVLLDEASYLKSEKEIEDFENTISSTARYLVMRLTKKELDCINNQQGKVTKTIEDPFNEYKRFFFEFQNIDNNDINEITVTRIEIFNS